MQGVSQKAATFSTLSDRVKNSLGNFFPFNLVTGTDDGIDTQEQGYDNEQNDNFESQLSFYSSTHEYMVTVNMKDGSSDQFGSVRGENWRRNRWTCKT